MPFAPLESFFDDTITLPILGKQYVIKSPDAEVGLWVIRTRALGQAISRGEQLDASDVEFLSSYTELDDEAALQKRVLGDAFAQMVADKVSWEYIKKATGTVMTWISSDRDAAERFWAQPAPKAPTPVKRQPQDRKPSKKAASPRPKVQPATPGSTS